WLPCRCPPSPGLREAGPEIAALGAPPGFLVQGVLRDAPQPPDRAAVDLAAPGRDLASGWRVHERHELVGEAGHRAADADAAHVRAAAEAVHPAPLGDVAVDHRAPAADLHQALGRVVVLREVALLVIARAVAALVHRLAEDPRRAQLVVERDHGRQA